MIASNKFQAAFNNFMTKGFEDAVDSSTTAYFGGGHYSVELFDDGTYRVLWSGNVGNLYDSPGIILRVPILIEDEWDEDPALRFYDNARDEMQEKFKETIEEKGLA